MGLTGNSAGSGFLSPGGFMRQFTLVSIPPHCSKSCHGVAETGTDFNVYPIFSPSG